MSQSLEQSEINEHTWSIALTLKKKKFKVRQSNHPQSNHNSLKTEHWRNQNNKALGDFL